MRVAGWQSSKNWVRRHPICLFIVLQGISLTAFAGQFEQGMESLKDGDFAEAYCIWRPLAKQGHIDASFHLGWLYANGNGLRVDITKAIYWWTQAAKQGHTDAMFALGLAYTTGEGIKKDLDLAVDWFLKAANSGHEDAREILKIQVRAGAKEIRSRLDELIQTPWLGQSVKVKVENANLRSGPGTESKLIGKIEKDATLLAINKQNGWFQVIKPDDLSYCWIAGWLTDPGME